MAAGTGEAVVERPVGTAAAGTPRREALREHGAMALFAALVSGSFSLGGLAAPHLDPTALNAVRFLLATLLIGGFVVARHGPGALAMPAAWRFLLLGGLLAVYFVLMFTALRLTDPVSTGAVFTLTPALAAIFGWFLLGQVTRPRAALALALAAAGALWVIFRADLEALLAFRIGPGEALFLVGCAAHALYTPLLRRLHRGEPLVVSTLGVLAGATLVLFLWGGRAIAGEDWAALPAVVWVAVLYLAVFTTAGTFWLLQFAALRLPAGKVMAYTYLVPGFIALWEGALGHGLPSAGVLAGFLLSAAALLLLLRD